ncbi:MAG: TetR/AcrR family transcriptional regulator [Phenylobacterium sp.]|uniref:TetR/AcrR family transcriptional regulator n=1 Tax=Phenylobacterium sp. TaxID=1871053 RepID=UPI0025D66F6E|nr:TetR/AcrR family transcriptional regulator [Phenylobacterium sp.]MCA6227035.1 TetR/AcrR family transcriptional regulator [Phenylobacterium sp.]MCA6231340.1 TetR/AcrR family transcriptional regulator [Phenylobacterium sp.]MCA6249686.1 TetR/AcrR family transcriptional regulator [Phenylobacterium sp.]MCA6250928.1 TetR/AcrR family transcriptional regulator [Phenylobacterium sp.]MCA6257576.1 TetR/AcrR family transcriptional regulator [Phenylobacterium sp.]
MAGKSIRPTGQGTPSRAGHSTPLELDWIAAAREMLVEGGVAAVQINPLAQRLGVTRGGFYWRFKNRQDLLDHLLADWESSNTYAFLKALEGGGAPKTRFLRMVRMFIDEREFDPRLEASVRQWGSIDPKVRARVSENDMRRIRALERLFLEAAQAPDEAMIRARIVYFHQVGYYALGFDESKALRRRLAPLYDRILTGLD